MNVCLGTTESPDVTSCCRVDGCGAECNSPDRSPPRQPAPLRPDRRPAGPPASPQTPVAPSRQGVHTRRRQQRSALGHHGLVEGPDAERLPAAEEAQEEAPEDGHTASGQRQGILERVPDQEETVAALRQDDTTREE